MKWLFLGKVLTDSLKSGPMFTISIVQFRDNSLSLPNSLTNPQQNPVFPDSRSWLDLGCRVITPSDWTDLNPQKGWLYRGPGLAPSDLPPPILKCRFATGWMSAYAVEFKSRRPDELNTVKTRSGRWGYESRGFAQYFSSQRKSEIVSVF